MSMMRVVSISIGCEYGGYTSDITRTWPVSGTFTDTQLAMYQAVLITQQTLIKVSLHYNHRSPFS